MQDPPGRTCHRNPGYVSEICQHLPHVALPALVVTGDDIQFKPFFQHTAGVVLLADGDQELCLVVVVEDEVGIQFNSAVERGAGLVVAGAFRCTTEEGVGCEALQAGEVCGAVVPVSKHVPGPGVFGIQLDRFLGVFTDFGGKADPFAGAHALRLASDSRRIGKIGAGLFRMCFPEDFCVLIRLIIVRLFGGTAGLPVTNGGMEHHDVPERIVVVGLQFHDRFECCQGFLILEVIGKLKGAFQPLFNFIGIRGICSKTGDCKKTKQQDTARIQET